MCKDCLGVKRPLHWGFYLPLHPGCAVTHSFTNGLAVLDVLTHPPFKFEMAPLHSCGASETLGLHYCCLSSCDVVLVILFDLYERGRER